jgi:hypothetical protein
MPSKDKLSVGQIKQLADDIRVINGFVENQGFDGSLFSVDVSPQSTLKKIDWPLIGLLVSAIACLSIVLIKVFGGFDGTASIGLLMIGLVAATAASMCTHLRFNSNVVTLIVGIGAIVIIAVGFGVITPREAIEKATQLGK